MGAYFDIGDSQSAVQQAIEKSENLLEARILEVELDLGNCINLQAPDIVVEFKPWQSNYRQRVGKEAFRKNLIIRKRKSVWSNDFLTRIQPL
jgi:hypothetical protein